jgi:hypothetical protein
MEVVTVESVARPDGGRRFEADEGCDPELAALVRAHRHESELVTAMREAGYRLTMVGGGAAPEETRRFYFRRMEDPDEA